VNADGSFSVGNIPPGTYVLRVRPAGLPPRGAETASMPITIATEDLTGLTITTRPGVTIKGRVEWDGTAPRPTNPVRIATRSAVWTGGVLGGESTITYLDPENGTVREDDSFELGGITGTVLFGSSPATPWMLKSATLNGRDITDVGIDDRSLGGDARVVITMTDKSTTITGTARDARRQPLSDYVVVVLPQRPIEGIAAQRWTRFVRSDQGGSFSVRSMPAGDYVAAAFETLESGRQWDPALQQAARTRGHRFTLTDGQTLPLDLELLR
jgi:hypothetical protein